MSDSSGTLVQHLSLDTQGDAQYKNIDFEFEEDFTYYCPECVRTLFSKEEEAITFLKGE